MLRLPTDFADVVGYGEMSLEAYVSDELKDLSEQARYLHEITSKPSELLLTNAVKNRDRADCLARLDILFDVVSAIESTLQDMHLMIMVHVKESGLDVM